MSVIRDANTQTAMKVNESGQALGQVETHVEARIHAEADQAFWLATGFLPLTNAAGFSAVFSLTNNSETKNISVGKLRTCSDQVCEWKMAHSITGGTIISDAISAQQMNLKIGATKPLVADVFKGSDGKTAVGTEVPTWINGIGHSQPDFAGSLILKPTQSIAFLVKPSVDGDVCLTVECWQSEPSE